MLGHLHLVPIFLCRPRCTWCSCGWTGRSAMRRFVVLMAAVFALQVLISTEVLFAGLIFGFTALLVAFWLMPASSQGHPVDIPPLFWPGGRQRSC